MNSVMEDLSYPSQGQVYMYLLHISQYFLQLSLAHPAKSVHVFFPYLTQFGATSVHGGGVVGVEPEKNRKIKIDEAPYGGF